MLTTASLALWPIKAYGMPEACYTSLANPGLGLLRVQVRRVFMFRQLAFGVGRSEIFAGHACGRLGSIAFCCGQWQGHEARGLVLKKSSGNANSVTTTLFQSSLHVGSWLRWDSSHSRSRRPTVSPCANSTVPLPPHPLHSHSTIIPPTGMVTPRRDW